ncbi:N-succinylglutamate 5-semialdehyde dehydrogenase [Caenibius tardaugens NBRC 16725]|uniref:N-succinylglutamate 5-semialdehyde dehydrogenase n=1 Tax=Caenibius tardaugens NBRC 16725 TaxID=1219035 RepID=U2YI01_9SPHN|nr:succinylglutamate-semialdehyde dehydrogenase [Caenibius tardaugens]AZI37119.1 aldehyde dehydrogenase family protein [Caenibius tardaugens NBRC 16725]GAD47642.1 N-succinylglutamate 5-semialdehyde dehydrogenase [Caenibius tardaugens NBRC 16725]
MNHEPIISCEPATGAVLWRGAPGDLDEAVRIARRAWPVWAAQPLATRIELLRRFTNEVRKEYDALADLIARETGKPLWDARNEVGNVIDLVEISVRAYSERNPRRKLDSALQGTSTLRHKPHGVLAIISPYCSPAEIPASAIIPALIAGNAVIVKPSDYAPATAELLARCFHNAGIDAAVVQTLQGTGAQGLALAMHPGVDGVLFTGSAQNGIALNRKLAANPGKLVSLNMGGNNPMIVWDTPKITDAAVLVIQSAFSGAGLRCTAIRRLIVKSTLYDPLMEEVKKLTDRIIVGEPMDEPAAFMGPMISSDHADQLTESFLYLLSHGGKAIKHMVRPRGALPFVSPAIIDVTAMAERPDVELFGPLLQVSRCDDFDQAIAEANATRFGLCAALVGGSPQDYNRFWANSRAGMINWNRPTHNPAPSATQGGTGLSGNHRPSGYYTADQCAYPVSSTEMEQPRAGIGVGFRDA